MKKRMLALLATFATVLGLTVIAATPAFAVEANACHYNAGLDKPILLIEAQAQGGSAGYIYKNQCTASQFGWVDAQKFYVPAGYDVKTWYLNVYGYAYVGHTITGTGYHMVADHIQGTSNGIIRLSIHNQ